MDVMNEFNYVLVAVDLFAIHIVLVVAVVVVTVVVVLAVDNGNFVAYKIPKVFHILVVVDEVVSVVV
jgi:hypothetical protein